MATLNEEALRDRISGAVLDCLRRFFMAFVNEDDLRTALSNLQYLISHCKAPDKLAGYHQMKAECTHRLLVMLNPQMAKRLRRAEALLASSQHNIASTRELLHEYRTRRKQ